MRLHMEKRALIALFFNSYPSFNFESFLYSLFAWITAITHDIITQKLRPPKIRLTILIQSTGIKNALTKAIRANSPQSIIAKFPSFSISLYFSTQKGAINADIKKPRLSPLAGQAGPVNKVAILGIFRRHLLIYVYLCILYV